MVFRDLECVRSIIETATGLEVSYAYEDLVFPDHAAFMIQFDDENSNHYYCYFHEDCDNSSKESIYSKLTQVCKTKNKTLEMKGSFNLRQKGEEVELSFM